MIVNLILAFFAVSGALGWLTLGWLVIFGKTVMTREQRTLFDLEIDNGRGSESSRPATGRE